jgi:hypothetical protein
MRTTAYLRIVDEMPSGEVELRSLILKDDKPRATVLLRMRTTPYLWIVDEIQG